MTQEQIRKYEELSNTKKNIDFALSSYETMNSMGDDYMKYVEKKNCIIYIDNLMTYNPDFFEKVIELIKPMQEQINKQIEEI